MEYGGLGLSVIEQLIFNEEMAEANAPDWVQHRSAWAGPGPTIIVYGTDEQKKKHLGAITNAETMWCQGFSEPNAGSDLANLSTRAVKDGDDYVINGQKIWTSGAHYADWMILIARTDQDAPKHKGISYFLVDMKTPGISTRPLIDMMNNHGFNEVFFENARVPASCLLGEENRGWYMATTTLDFERSSIGGAVGGQADAGRAGAVHTHETKLNGQRLVGRHAGAHAAGGLGGGGRSLGEAALVPGRRRCRRGGMVPNYESSIAKLFNTDMQLRMAQAGMRDHGPVRPARPQLEAGAAEGPLRAAVPVADGPRRRRRDDGDPEEHHRPARPRDAAGLTPAQPWKEPRIS